MPPRPLDQRMGGSGSRAPFLGTPLPPLTPGTNQRQARTEIPARTLVPPPGSAQTAPPRMDPLRSPLAPRMPQSRVLHRNVNRVIFPEEPPGPRVAGPLGPAVSPPLQPEENKEDVEEAKAAGPEPAPNPVPSPLSSSSLVLRETGDTSQYELNQYIRSRVIATMNDSKRLGWAFIHPIVTEKEAERVSFIWQGVGFQDFPEWLQESMRLNYSTWTKGQFQELWHRFKALEAAVGFPLLRVKNMDKIKPKTLYLYFMALNKAALAIDHAPTVLPPQWKELGAVQVPYQVLKDAKYRNTAAVWPPGDDIFPGPTPPPKTVPLFTSSTRSLKDLRAFPLGQYVFKQRLFMVAQHLLKGIGISMGWDFERRLPRLSYDRDEDTQWNEPSRTLSRKKVETWKKSRGTGAQAPTGEKGMNSYSFKGLVVIIGWYVPWAYGSGSITQQDLTLCVDRLRMDYDLPDYMFDETSYREDTATFLELVHLEYEIRMLRIRQDNTWRPFFETRKELRKDATAFRQALENEGRDVVVELYKGMSQLASHQKLINALTKQVPSS